MQTGHAVQEATYAYVAWIFAQHFLNRLGAAYMSLKNILNPDDVTQANVLAEIRKRLREETFTRQSILESLQAYPDLLRLLYVQFAMTHHTSQIADELVPTLSYQRLHSGHVLSDDELAARIRKTVTDRHDLEIFEALMVFNKSILKTNFFTPTSALCRASRELMRSQRSRSRSASTRASCPTPSTRPSRSGSSSSSAPSSAASTSASRTSRAAACA